MKLKVYAYENCATCRKALHFLRKNEIDYFTVSIRDKPPSRGELKRMLRHQGGQLRRLFNTSSIDYHQMKLKDRMRFMSETELLELLAKNGNLIKRPFVLTRDSGMVGFREAEWNEKLGISRS